MLVAAGIFESIGIFFKTVFQLISDFFTDLIFVINSFVKTFTSLPSWLNWLPVQVVTLFMSCITIIVVYKILGRD